jgi:hypothetical protein
MRRGWIILGVGLVAACVAYWVAYLIGSAEPRRLLRSERPELAWLKHEFRLSESEFDRIAALHEAYLPRCEEMCRQIVEQEARLDAALAVATGMNPEIEGALAESARLRSECWKNMLEHFFEVSRMMSPQAGRRYLEWAREQILAREGVMSGMTRHAH